MPRRKHGYINRSTVKTYQVVHASGGDAADAKHVLVPVNDAAVSSGLNLLSDNHETRNLELGATTGGQLDVSHLNEAYDKNEYEFGEFGFADDGYDYSKHFKTIGGGGGVFMDAQTGMPNPDAVAGSSGNAKKANVDNGKDGIVLKEDVKEEEDGFPVFSWRLKEDVALTQKAIKEIKRERKINRDLDEVFAALDSEGELDSSSNLGDESGDEEDSILGVETELENDLLEDDFVTAAQKADEVEAVDNQTSKLDGVLEEYREPRLLDEQFEKFMRNHRLQNSDDDDDSEDFYPNEASNDVADVEDFQAHMTTQELDDLLGGEGSLLDDLSKLEIGTESEAKDGEADNRVPNVEASTVETDSGPDRLTEYEDFTNAEFERGMEGLLDSYARIPALDALGAFDGVDKAFEAIARQEREEQDKIDQRLLHGLEEESDGHDSELDSKFDEMFLERDDKWDCETILSTYSNLDNHPSVIDAPSGTKRRSVQKQPIIRLDPRTQAPEGYMPSVGAPWSGPELMDYGSSRREIAQNTQARERGETAEQKRARKAAVKEAARERRALKSEMKKAFGSEKVKQTRHETSLGTSKVAMKF